MLSCILCEAEFNESAPYLGFSPLCRHLRIGRLIPSLILCKYIDVWAQADQTAFRLDEPLLGGPLVEKL
jgi:hypothetical protein